MSEQSTRVRGGPPPSAITLRAVEILEDGEWHDYDRLLAELAKLVPPGKAWRRAEQDRLSTSNAPERKRERATERIIESGARSIARQHLKNPEHFEVVPRVGGMLKAGERRRIRLRALPPRVAAARERSELEAANAPRPASEIVALLSQAAAEGDVFAVLDNLSRVELERAVVDLVYRLDER